MKDLTHGSIYRHLIAMAAPIAAGMLLQTLYHIVDLYFVSIGMAVAELPSRGGAA